MRKRTFCRKVVPYDFKGDLLGVEGGTEIGISVMLNNSYRSSFTHEAVHLLEANLEANPVTI